MTQTDEIVGTLGDIPDLSGVEDARPDPFEDGWYEGVILGKREFTDANGNDRVFESSDAPSASGSGRNIRLQVALKRSSDGRTLNTSTLVFYRPADLSPETIQAVLAQKEKVKGGEEWGKDLYGPFMTLTKLSKLQKIAGVRQLQRNGNGGLEISPLFGKTAYFKIGNDDRNPQYKAVKDFRGDRPTRVPVL